MSYTKTQKEAEYISAQEAIGALGDTTGFYRIPTEATNLLTGKQQSDILKALVSQGNMLIEMTTNILVKVNAYEDRIKKIEERIGILQSDPALLKDLIRQVNEKLSTQGASTSTGTVVPVVRKTYYVRDPKKLLDNVKASKEPSSK